MFPEAEVQTHILALTTAHADAKLGRRNLRDLAIDENTTFGALSLGDATTFARLLTALEDRWGKITLPPNINIAALTIAGMATIICPKSRADKGDSSVVPAYISPRRQPRDQYKKRHGNYKKKKD